MEVGVPSLTRRMLPILAAGFALVVAGEDTHAATRAYIMRGLMDVSTGLDELAAKLKRRGITAVVANHAAGPALAEQAIARYKSAHDCVVIIGHSLGADAAIQMAETLKGAGVPVALIVAFSPASSRAVPGNVSRAVNYYQSNSFWNHVLSRGAGFRGGLRNVDLAKRDDIHHFNIEKSGRLHAETLGMVAAAAATCEGRAQSPAPAAKPPE
jgi:hypothetical protein